MHKEKVCLLTLANIPFLCSITMKWRRNMYYEHKTMDFSMIALFFCEKKVFFAENILLEKKKYVNLQNEIDIIPKRNFKKHN